jgi:hypothetical protein
MLDFYETYLKGKKAQRSQQEKEFEKFVNREEKRFKGYD